MGASGCRIIGIGIESGIPKHQQLLGKNINLGILNRKLELLKRNGIFTIVYFLIGHPFDTTRTINYNIAYSKTLNSTFVEFTPYVDFRETDLGGTRTLHRITPVQVKRLKKRGELLFYMRPRKILELVQIVVSRAFQEIERSPRLFFNMIYYFFRMLYK